MNDSFKNILYNNKSAMLEPGNVVIEVASKSSLFSREESEVKGHPWYKLAHAGMLRGKSNRDCRRQRR